MKKNLCLVMVVLMSLSVVTPAYAETAAECHQKRIAAEGGGYTGELTGYTTRIAGTLTQRGNDFYYVLPDGTDLKNGFVDGNYFSWTGTMAKKYPKNSNQAIYNTVYGGADYTRYPHERTDFWTVLNINDFKVKGIDVDVVQSSFLWMDSVAQEAVKLGERDRAVYLANVVADKLTYGVFSSNTNTSADSCQDNYIYATYSGIGRCQAYSELYSALCRKSGLAVTYLSGIASNGDSHMWNYVRVDGSWLFVDTTFYDIDRNAAYLLQKDIFPGYSASLETLPERIEGF